MVSILDMWTKMSAVPMGKKAFSLAFSQKAPYFATIRPTFQRVEPNHVELTFPKRRSVHNHIGTVHAIALCNGAEAAMGLTQPAPRVRIHTRWPSGGLGRPIRMRSRPWSVRFHIRCALGRPAAPRPLTTHTPCEIRRFDVRAPARAGCRSLHGRPAACPADGRLPSARCISRLRVPRGAGSRRQRNERIRHRRGA